MTARCVVCRRPTEQRMTVPTAYGDLTLPRCEARDCHEAELVGIEEWPTRVTERISRSTFRKVDAAFRRALKPKEQA